MVELLGVLLAMLILGAALLLRRAWLGVRGWMAGAGPQRATGRVRGAPLRLSRAVRRRQSARIDDLVAELARTRRLLREAERARGAARDGAVDGDRFQRAKRAFALHFHPDRLRAHPEAPVRRRIFQEFWPVLRRIERS